MSFSCRSAIQSLSLFKANGNPAIPAEIDDFLHASAARSLRNQHPIDRPASLQGFTNRMYPNQYTHDLDVTVIEITYFSRDR